MTAADTLVGTLSSKLGNVQAAGRRLHTWRPSFLRRRSATLRPTAYLDGIRGFAALLVYFLHHSGEAHGDWAANDNLESAFGYRGQYFLGAFPGIRLFFSGGHFAVSIFYVLSGYVLSTKALKLIHAGDMARLAEALSSSVFRRWLRLFLPVFIFTLLPVFLWHILGVKWSLSPYQFDDYFSVDVARWWTGMWRYTSPLKGAEITYTDLHVHVWSLPVEMKGSLVVYLALMAFGPRSRPGRLICSTVLMIYFLYFVDGALFAMFVAGMLICDLDLLAVEGHLPNFLHHLEPMKDRIFLAMFVVAVYLGGVPTNRPEPDIDLLDTQPGWEYIGTFQPQAAGDHKWFFLFFASSMLVASVPHIKWLKTFFESSLCQNLGRISFMFYLVHGPIMWTIGIRLYCAVGAPVGSRSELYPTWQNRFPLPGWGFFGMEFNYVVVMLGLLPFTMWLSELATVVIDDNVLKFVAWLHKITMPASSLPPKEGPPVLLV